MKSLKINIALTIFSISSVMLLSSCKDRQAQAGGDEATPPPVLTEEERALLAKKEAFGKYFEDGFEEAEEYGCYCVVLEGEKEVYLKNITFLLKKVFKGKELSYIEATCKEKEAVLKTCWALKKEGQEGEEK